MHTSQVFAFAVVFLAVGVLITRLNFSELLTGLQDFVDSKTYEWFIDDCRGQAHEPDHEENPGDRLGEVHVVYAADASSFRGLLTSMLSLSRHLEVPGACVIHIVVRGMDMSEAGRLVQCFQVELDDLGAIPEVKIHEVRRSPLNLTVFKEVWSEVWPSGARFLTSLSFVPLYLHEYLPTAPRAVYLSPDTVVKADVRRLYQMPMRTALAAALDQKCVTWRSEYLHELDQLDPSILNDVSDIDARTLNTRIAVFDLDRWRKDGLTQRVEYWVMRASGVKTTRLALNLVFRDKFDVLNWRWNVMGLMILPPRRCIDEAHILDWDGNNKERSQDVPERLRGLYDELTGPFLQTRQCSWSDDTSMLDTDTDIFAA